MDFFSYRGLPLTVLQSMVHERAPQHDKSHTTYECTRWLVSFMLSYNPGASSYVAAAAGPQAGRGSMPVVTDNAIRAFLEEPRGQLIVRSASNPNFTPSQLANAATDPGSLVILSPAPGAPCDPRNGPFCKVNTIQFVPGERLWKIHLTIETYVTATVPRGTRELILNNRWSVQTDINWQHQQTRVYQGICTVNAGLLNTPGFDPRLPGTTFQLGVLDSIRQAFAGFSVPTGYQRTFVKVEMTPDGNNAAYVVRDEQRHYNQPNNPNVPRIEVMDSNWMQQGSWGLATLDVVTGSFVRAWARIPKYKRTCIVRVWGNQIINRGDMVTIALQVAQSRIGGVLDLFAPTTSELVVTGDSNQCVTANLTIQWSLGDQILIFPAAAAFTPQGVFGNVGIGPRSADWKNSLGIDLTLTTVGGFRLTPNSTFTNPPLGGGAKPANSVFGVFPELIAPMITQVLEEFGGKPGNPP